MGVNDIDPMTNPADRPRSLGQPYITVFGLQLRPNPVAFCQVSTTLPMGKQIIFTIKKTYNVIRYVLQIQTQYYKHIQIYKNRCINLTYLPAITIQ